MGVFSEVGVDVNEERSTSISQSYKWRFQQGENIEKEQIWPQQEGIYLSPGSVGGDTQLSTSCNISCPRFLETKHPRTTSEFRSYQFCYCLVTFY